MGNGTKIEVGQVGIYENPHLPGNPTTIVFSRAEIPSAIPSTNCVVVDGGIVFNYLRAHHPELLRDILQRVGKLMLHKFRSTSNTSTATTALP